MFKNMLNKKKFLVSASGVAVAVLVSTPAFAALDASVTTAMTATTADIVEAGGLLIGLAVVGLGLRWVKGMFF